MLLQAAVLYDGIKQESGDALPPLILVVTGRGPDKPFYLDHLRTMTLRNVAIRTAWLAPQDYASLLACADLGVSLHASSSDLDLPMKVSDMLGSCAPCPTIFAPCLLFPACCLRRGP